MKSTVLGVS